ncbi:lytic polysaccharide monooxygenase, partial [Chromobacterium haemolyticum]
MSQSRKAGSFALPALALSQIAASLMLLAPVAASAHGSMEEPISRIKYCHSADNPESPRTPGCQAVKQGGGSQAIYDWNSVLQGSAHGNHQQVVPNGKLCAGGAKKFGGLDAAVDWPATTIQPGP